MTALSPCFDLSQCMLDSHDIDDDSEGQPGDHYDGEDELLNKEESSRVYQEAGKRDKNQYGDSLDTVLMKRSSFLHLCEQQVCGVSSPTASA